jgi:hypothetical protein
MPPRARGRLVPADRDPSWGALVPRLGGLRSSLTSPATKSRPSSPRFHVNLAFGADGVRHLALEGHETDHTKLLEIQGPRFLANGTDDLHAVAWEQGANHLSELPGGFVGRHTHRAESEDNVTSNECVRRLGNRACVSPGGTRSRDPGIEHVVIGSLVRDKHKPTIRLFSANHPKGAGQLGWPIPPDSEQHGTRRSRSDHDAVVLEIVVTVGARKRRIHAFDRLGIDLPLRSPS